MARPTRCRRICMEPAYDSFFPDGFLTGEEVIMTLDEYETIRLIDLEEYTQHECAKQMNISRTTAAEIYKSAMPEEELEGLAGEILSLLQRQRVMHMDQIAAELEVSMEELTTTLTELELYGKLERLPGKQFRRMR